ncbi:MAG: antibiotic biosynthesis monooxygenase [Planctomycetota bacterium]|nr:antibiotic biosynthesis monooxygenase [Planctomycetota bacterium]
MSQRGNESSAAALPPTGVYAVIFASTRPHDATDDYGDWSARMAELAREQPGFLGIESVRGEDGRGISVSYWASEADIAAWKAVAEHREAQRLGMKSFYSAFTVVVAKVERAYAFTREGGKRSG